MSWIGWLFCFLSWQYEAYYFLDGVELHLDTGVVIMTAQEVKEDRFTYSWREDGEFLSFEKRNVKSVKYFSWPVRGIKPKKSTKTAVQRRISGDPVAYDVKGVTYLKVRHVDDRGRSTEGRVFNNLVRELREVSSQPDGESVMALKMINVKDQADLELRFYNKKGKLLYKAFVDLGTVTRSRKDRKAEVLHHQFELPESLDIESLGLVEALILDKKN